jgi:hypothetical protein
MVPVWLSCAEELDVIGCSRLDITVAVHQPWRVDAPERIFGWMHHDKYRRIRCNNSPTRLPPRGVNAPISGVNVVISGRRPSSPGNADSKARVLMICWAQ